MEIHIQGVYQSGVIRPEQPLILPDGTRVHIVVAPISDLRSENLQERPSAPRISRAELDDRIARYAVSVGSLRTDFSRGDTYSHDE